jgi:hypothetical protein
MSQKRTNCLAIGEKVRDYRFVKNKNIFEKYVSTVIIKFQSVHITTAKYHA